MTWQFWISQIFNGVSYGALLFLLAGGLSLIFGMMRIVNMTHGSYYLLGGYVALTVIWRTGQLRSSRLLAGRRSPSRSSASASGTRSSSA